jgi:hypothetical protein
VPTTLRLRYTFAERRAEQQSHFYESLGLAVIYEGPEYPNFIAFGTDRVDFGIQQAFVDNDPPSVLAWQIGVADIDVAIAVCASCGLDYVLDVQKVVARGSCTNLAGATAQARPTSGECISRAMPWWVSLNVVTLTPVNRLKLRAAWAWS